MSPDCKDTQDRSAPRVRQSLFLGQEETFLLATPGEGGGAYELGVKPARTETLWDAATLAAWGFSRPLVDVRGNGHPQEVEWGNCDRWLPSLTGGKGAQRLTWTHTWQDPAQMQLYSYEALDQPRLIWETEPEPMAYSPLTLVGDFDGDGRPEIVTSRGGGNSVFDALTGKRKARLDYRRLSEHRHHFRQYGFFGSHPLPSGKGTAFVVVSDFGRNLAAVSYEDSQLRLLWMHLHYPPGYPDIPPEGGIIRHFSFLRVVPNALGDFDGDGRVEVAISVFDKGGDQRWHVLGYDVLTGEVNFDLPDRYAVGLEDVTGNGRKELFCQVLTSRAEPTYPPLELVRLNAGRTPEVLWKVERARWNLHESANQPLDQWNAQTYGNRRVALRQMEEGKEFCISRPVGAPGDAASGAGEIVEAWRIGRDGAVRKTWEAISTGKSEIEVHAVSPDQRQVLLRAWSRGPAEVRFEGARGEVVCARLRNQSPPFVSLARDAQGRPWVVATDSSRHVSFFSPEEKGLRLARELPGRAMTTCFARMPYGLEVADVDGDGAQEVVFAQEILEGGGARIVALGLDGRERWHFDIPGFSGRTRHHNGGGINYWKVGHFLSPERLDLAVSLRRSPGGSDEIHLVNTETGETVWRRWHVKDLDIMALSGKQDLGLDHGFGGQPMTTLRLEDGHEDLTFWTDFLFVADGPTGAMHEAHYLRNHEAAKGLGFWGGPLVTADLDGDGCSEILCTGNADLLCALRLKEGKASLLWLGEPRKWTTALPGLACLRSGELVVGAAGCPDGFVAVNGCDGSMRWKTEIEDAPATNTVVVSSTGNAQPEFIFAAGKRLFSLSASSGEQRWSFELPDAAAQVLAAETGAGATKLVVATQSGYLLLLDLPRR